MAGLIRLGTLALLLAGFVLPATAASLSEGQRIDFGVEGKRFVGVVRNLYVQVADNVLLDAARAPKTAIGRDTVHFADVEIPEFQPNGNRTIRAQLVAMSAVQVGDVVEIRIAHKDNPRFFPVKETTRVTELVARSDTRMARLFAANGTPAARPGVSPLPAMLQTNPGSGITDN